MVFNACQKKEPIPQVEEVSSDESDNASYESDSISFQYSFPTADQEFIAAQAEAISSLQEQVDEYAEEIASLTCSLLKATGKFSIVGVIQAYADKKKFDLNSFNDWTTIFNEDKPITALRTSLQCDLSSQHFTDALTAILQKPAALQTNSSTESGSIVVKKSDFTRMELFTIKLICNALLLKVIVE
uniref:Lipoprotein n=1 Tax=Panagrellus redivivus TaxID=6233 RepID=A0A7E4VU50_PANRE